MFKHASAATFCLLTATLSASAGQDVSLEARAKGSQAVVIATVEDVRSRFGSNTYGDQVILSDLQLDVAEKLKGDVPSVVTVTIEGGQLGELALRVSDMPEMRAGERAVFFLDRSAKGLSLHGRGLGVLKLDEAGRVRGTDLTVDDVRRSVRDASK